MTDAIIDRKFPCPCCGYLTLKLQPPGSFHICPVCRWEDDNVQFDDPAYAGGANRESLNEARKNFKRFGARAERDLPHVRKSLPEEQG